MRVTNDEIQQYVELYGFDATFTTWLYASTFQDKVTQRLVRALLDARRQLAEHLCMEDEL